MPPILQDSMRESDPSGETMKQKPARSNVFTAICNVLELGPEDVDTLESNNINSGDFKIRRDDLYSIYLKICEIRSITPAYIKTEEGGYMTQKRLSELEEDLDSNIQVVRH